jgi:two-component system, NarL family, response regulator NreC
MSGQAAPTKVVIADDHPISRRGLRALFDAEADIEVVAEAGDLPSAFRLVRAHRPHVLVLDLHMPGGPSLPAIPELRAGAPAMAIVILTMQRDPAFARLALRAGAAGYVLKEAADEELVQAIRRAVEGRTYLHPELGAKLAADQPAAEVAPDDLTDREVEVLRLIALGHTNREIAAQLYVSIRTVESHRATLQRKLALAGRSELVRYARERGLFDSGAS